MWLNFVEGIRGEVPPTKNTIAEASDQECGTSQYQAIDWRFQLLGRLAD
jgi:hypothetical protein